VGGGAAPQAQKKSRPCPVPSPLSPSILPPPSLLPSLFFLLLAPPACLHCLFCPPIRPPLSLAACLLLPERPGRGRGARLLSSHRLLHLLLPLLLLRGPSRSCWHLLLDLPPGHVRCGLFHRHSGELCSIRCHMVPLHRILLYYQTFGAFLAAVMCISTACVHCVLSGLGGGVGAEHRNQTSVCRSACGSGLKLCPTAVPARKVGRELKRCRVS
jgi:hypothetical protein